MHYREAAKSREMNLPSSVPTSISQRYTEYGPTTLLLDQNPYSPANTSHKKIHVNQEQPDKELRLQKKEIKYCKISRRKPTSLVQKGSQEAMTNQAAIKEYDDRGFAPIFINYDFSSRKYSDYQVWPTSMYLEMDFKNETLSRKIINKFIHKESPTSFCGPKTPSFPKSKCHSSLFSTKESPVHNANNTTNDEIDILHSNSRNFLLKTSENQQDNTGASIKYSKTTPDDKISQTVRRSEKINENTSTSIRSDPPTAKRRTFIGKFEPEPSDSDKEHDLEHIFVEENTQNRLALQNLISIVRSKKEIDNNPLKSSKNEETPLDPYYIGLAVIMLLTAAIIYEIFAR
jgi:hypothetical protein